GPVLFDTIRVPPGGNAPRGEGVSIAASGAPCHATGDPRRGYQVIVAILADEPVEPPRHRPVLEAGALADRVTEPFNGPLAGQARVVDRLGIDPGDALLGWKVLSQHTLARVGPTTPTRAEDKGSQSPKGAWSAESCIRKAVAERGLTPSLVGLADAK